ncbi:MAG: alpha/beta fold hydrolase [Gemmatimonadales bacterium]|jgi:pimeloyl-ACP methyl ester carboxylesterase
MRNFVTVALAFLVLSPTSCADDGVAQSTEEISFRSGEFRVVGELTTPTGNALHPVVVFVHGDGPASRRNYRISRERALRAGYATFVYDKPGYGVSEPAYDRSRLFEQRTQVLLDAVAMLKAHPALDGERIGLWGISQAGYVMPQAIARSNDIAFMIAVSCPGTNSIDQGAFLLRAQCLCEGQAASEAQAVEEHFAGLYVAGTYAEYLSHAEPLIANPVVVDIGFVSAITPRDEWQPRDPQGQPFFDPMTLIERTTIPVLAFFGEKDTQIDPFQGAEAYRAALDRAGNADYRVVLVPGVDHSMVISETGCMKERSRRSRTGWRNYAPEYLDPMEEWLRRLRG